MYLGSNEKISRSLRPRLCAEPSPLVVGGSVLPEPAGVLVEVLESPLLGEAVEVSDVPAGALGVSEFVDVSVLALVFGWTASEAAGAVSEAAGAEAGAGWAVPGSALSLPALETGGGVSEVVGGEELGGGSPVVSGVVGVSPLTGEPWPAGAGAGAGAGVCVFWSDEASSLVAFFLSLFLASWAFCFSSPLTSEGAVFPFSSFIFISAT